VRPPQIKSRKRRREESPLPGIFEGMEYGVDGSTRTSAGSRLRLHRIRRGSPSEDIPDGFQSVLWFLFCHDYWLGFAIVSNVHRIAIFLNFSCERPDIALGMIIFYDMPNEIRVI